MIEPRAGADEELGPAGNSRPDFFAKWNFDFGVGAPLSFTHRWAAFGSSNVAFGSSNTGSLFFYSISLIVIVRGRKWRREGNRLMAKQLHRRNEIPFYQKFTLPWERKLQGSTFLVWDGSYRWFCSDNVIPLERYQDSTTVERVRTNILSKLPQWRY